MRYDKERITIKLSKKKLDKLGISSSTSNTSSNTNSDNNSNVIETTADIITNEDTTQLVLKALDITLFLIEKIVKSLGIAIITTINTTTNTIMIGPILIDGGGLAFTRFTEARLLNEPLPEVLASSSIQRLKLKLQANTNTTSSNSNDQSINSNSTIPTSNKWVPLSGFITKKKSNTDTNTDTNTNTDTK
jgi:hypothetical protein